MQGTKIDSSRIAQWSADLGDSSAQEVLEWAAAEFGDRLVLANSLGVEDMLLTHLVAGIQQAPRVFVLDTGRLNQETYDVMGEARAKYGFEFEMYFPEASRVEQLVRSKGPNSFFDSVENRKECCGIRKVEPLRRVLSSADAWITGLRHAQSPERAHTPLLELDEAHGGILKINPLIRWSDHEVWQFVRENRVPYNVLHDRGYPSIGCAPCTRAIAEGESPRAGRWWWEDATAKECGLHVKE